MDQIKAKLLRTQILQPMVWFRYIDDIFFIWTRGEEKLKEFIADFNAFNPNIQFTFESSKEIISFLNLDVALSNARLESTVQVELTDRYQYLHNSSSHPKHTKRSFVISQTLHVSRICFHENDSQDNCLKMTLWFLKGK